MNPELREFLGRWQRVILVYAAAGAVVFAVWAGIRLDRLNTMRPVEDGPAAKYLAEYIDWERTLSGREGYTGRYKAHDGNEVEAPDKSATIFNKFLYLDCRSYWVETKEGKRSRILRMGGIERQRGAPGRHVWSEDSKAVFFAGTQHTTQCGNSPEGRVRVVHLVDDGITYRMPKDDVDQYWWGQ